MRVPTSISALTKSATCAYCQSSSCNSQDVVFNAISGILSIMQVVVAGMLSTVFTVVAGML